MMNVRSARRRLITGAAAIALAGSVASATAGLTQAQAAQAGGAARISTAAPAVARKATVVKVVRRHPFGKMLATVKGRSLYILPVGRCNAACLTAWPPLLMPKGTKIPKGTRCLGTAKFHHRLQVTYRKKRLYLFIGDSGNSVNGNNVSGFKVAKFSAKACPK